MLLFVVLLFVVLLFLVALVLPVIVLIAGWWRRRRRRRQFRFAVLSHAMQQSQRGHRRQVVGFDLQAPVPGGAGAGGADHGQVGAVSLHMVGGGNLHREGLHMAGHHHRRQALAGLGDAQREALGLGRVLGPEGGGVGHIGLARAHELTTELHILLTTHRHRQGEAVEQLRPQFALFGVHAADQGETRFVAVTQPLALDQIDPRLAAIEQTLDQVVVEQVDLVDVEDALVHPLQEAGFENRPALVQRCLEIEAAEDPVLGRAQRQVDEGDALLAACDQIDQTTGSSRFRRPLLASQQYAAQARIDQREQQRLPHVVLPDQSHEGVV